MASNKNCQLLTPVSPESDSTDNLTNDILYFELGTQVTNQLKVVVDNKVAWQMQVQTKPLLKPMAIIYFLEQVVQSLEERDHNGSFGIAVRSGSNTLAVEQRHLFPQAQKVQLIMITLIIKS